MDRGKKAAAPAALAAVRVVLPRNQDDEGGQILVVAAQAVAEPRADAGAPDDLVPGVHEDLRRRVIELRRLHRADDGDLVGVLPEIGQERRQLRAGLSVLAERER